MSTNTVII
jgi:hypothetical protein